MFLRHSLQSLLIIIFVSQILFAVGLTGWFAYWNGQRSVDDIAQQLQQEITARIRERLQRHLAIPHQINRINADGLRLGTLNSDSVRDMQQYFWQQAKNFPSVSYIGLGLPNGDYIGAQAQNDDKVLIEVVDQDTQGHLETWSTNEQAQLIKQTNTRNNYDPRKRPWYLSALENEAPTWSDIHIYFSGTSVGLSANHAIRDPETQEVQAVFSTDLTLAEISAFLRTLHIGENGQTFIMERSGKLVASSTGESPTRMNLNSLKHQRFSATDSEDPLTQETAHALKKHFGDFNAIKHSEYLQLPIQEEDHFLQVVPFSDPWGLDWLIVVSVPENDFMGTVEFNTRITLILCSIAVLLAILFGIWTARWLTRPIHTLSNASQSLAQGDWSQIQNTARFTHRKDEVGQLANAFNSMATQLQDIIETLEDKVKERTRNIEQQNHKLSELNDTLIKLNQDKNEFLGIAAHDLKNPLFAIQGMAQVIEQSVERFSKEQIKEFATMMHKSAGRMFELIRNLLDVNAIESGKLRIAPQSTDLLPLVQGLAEQYRERGKAKEIDVQCDCPAESYIAFVDAGTVRQILDNLISNAVKYSPHGRNVSIRLHPDKDRMLCSVQDQGPGLSVTDQEKLFGKFARLSAQPTGGEHSTGLGLFIVKKLVEAMHGEVWCESDMGHGATFITSFPISA